jgi:hypothetical protein
VPSTFERARYQFLVYLAGTRPFASQNFGMGGHEAPQKLRVLVVHVADLVFAQITMFVADFRYWHILENLNIKFQISNFSHICPSRLDSPWQAG